MLTGSEHLFCQSLDQTITTDPFLSTDPFAIDKGKIRSDQYYYDTTTLITIPSFFDFLNYTSPMVSTGAVDPAGDQDAPIDNSLIYLIIGALLYHFRIELKMIFLNYCIKTNKI